MIKLVITRVALHMGPGRALAKIYVRKNVGIFYSFVRKFMKFLDIMKDLFNYKVVCI